jgi:hypothetical protein
MEERMTTSTPSRDDEGEQRHEGRFARQLPTVARVVMGLIFFVIGLNGFFFFLPQPSTIPAGAIALNGAFMQSGYLFQLIMGTQVVVGVLLLSNRFVPLALAVTAPVVVNIISFHVFLWPASIGLPLLVLALELYLAWAYRAAFRPMLALRATPGTP